MPDLYLSTHVGLKFDRRCLRSPAIVASYPRRHENSPLWPRTLRSPTTSLRPVATTCSSSSALVLFASGMPCFVSLSLGLCFCACPASSSLSTRALLGTLAARRPSRGILPCLSTLPAPRVSLSNATVYFTVPMNDNAWRCLVRVFVASAPPDTVTSPPQPARCPEQAPSHCHISGLSHTERVPLGSWVDSLSGDQVQRSCLPARYVASEAVHRSRIDTKAKVSAAIDAVLASLPVSAVAASAFDGEVARHLGDTCQNAPVVSSHPSKSDFPDYSQKGLGGQVSVCSSSSSSSSASWSSSSSSDDLSVFTPTSIGSCVAGFTSLVRLR